MDGRPLQRYRLEEIKVELEKVIGGLTVEDIVTDKEDGLDVRLKKARNRQKLQAAFEKYYEGR